MHHKWRVVLGVCFFLWGNTITADGRMEIPTFLNHSWIGLTGGFANTDFSAEDFQSGFTFSDQQDHIGALRLQIGHYIDPFWAVSLSLMRGVHSNKFSDPAYTGTYSVSQSLLSLTVLPTLPLEHGFSVYAEGGAGLISRNGFDIQGSTVVSDANILTGVLGGGLLYTLPYSLFLKAEAIYTLPVDSQQQPGILYVGLGLNYLLIDTKDPSIRDVQEIREPYDFPMHFLEVTYMNEDWFSLDAAPYFTPPDSIPIFFDGHIKIGRGIEMTYQRNFFHTLKNFSLDWGVSVGSWQTQELKQSFYTFSVFPEMKIWMIRSHACDMYFTYSLAGPSYISERYLDHQDSGSHFTFQDFLGFGTVIGHNKRITCSVKIVHYSNGNLLPQNPGVDVPVMIGLGLAF